MAEHKNVIEALAAIAAEITHVAKTGEFNQSGTRFSFRGIDAVLAAVHPICAAHGVVPLPNVLEYEDGPAKIDDKGQPRGHRIVARIEHRFYHESDASLYVTATTLGEGVDYGDKSANKAMSQALKYALTEALTLPTDEPDPEQDKPDTDHVDADQARQRAADARFEDWKEAMRRTIGDHGDVKEVTEQLAADHPDETPRDETGKIRWGDASFQAKMLQWARAWVNSRSEAPQATETEPAPERSSQRDPFADAKDGGEPAGDPRKGELVTLLAMVDPTGGTNDEIEQRTRRMYSLAESLGVFPVDTFHQNLMGWYGHEHYGDLRVKANMQAFAERSWREASEAFDEWETKQ